MNNISVKKIITDYLRERNLQIVDLKESCNKQVREDIIKLLVSESGLSLREIAIELGLGREIVRRAYVSKEPSP